jgi:hypothetical protein
VRRELTPKQLRREKLDLGWDLKILTEVHKYAWMCTSEAVKAGLVHWFGG